MHRSNHKQAARLGEQSVLDSKKQDSGDVDELILISKVAEGDSDSLNELIQRHSGICVDTYKRYLNLPSMSNFVSDEIISSKDYIIYNSAKTFNPEKGAKFSTWLSNQTRFFCLNCINKYGKLIPTEDDGMKALLEKRQKLEGYDSPNKGTKNEILDLIKETLNSLTNKKIKECINRKYFSGDGEHRTYTEIAKEMNVTVQTVINWHKKFTKLIKQKCKNKKISFDFS